MNKSKSEQVRETEIRGNIGVGKAVVGIQAGTSDAKRDRLVDT
jgi:hypothetical protein